MTHPLAQNVRAFCVEPARDPVGNGPAVSGALVTGAHIVSPRPGYTHHGIYLGQGKVAQYGGFARGLHRGKIEEVTLDEFGAGHGFEVCDRRDVRFDANEIVRRARSRLGEDRYHLFTNNCEHFCEWCLRGEHRSYQVEQWLSQPRRALESAYWTIRAFLALRSETAGRV